MTEAAKHTPGETPDKETLLGRVASEICGAACGLYSECRSREAARALFDAGYLTGPDMLAALHALVTESGGKAIPNDRLTLARNHALAVIARVEAARTALAQARAGKHRNPS